ncbi:MAG: Wzz/FepE/Etk N-terminal domain-containing protein [Bacteroidota bacterium]|nr:Wzz/FepE/Etk N-terminal domain-containing protein [Bacteroidota bacterium]
MEIIKFDEIIKLIWKRRRLLVTIAICTVILSAIISYIIPEYYRSVANIFTAKLLQTPVNETAFRRGNLSDFGETEEAEQTIEILNSVRLQEKVIEQLSLYDHYKIKKDEPFARTFALETFDGNVTLKRTKFNTVQIGVIDKDPQMAADIANAIIENFDTIKYRIINERAQNLVRNLEAQKAKQHLIVDSLKQLMDTFSKRGVMSQFQRGYLIQAYAESSASERAHLKSLVDDNIRFGEDFDRIERVYESEIENEMLINKFLTQTLADAETQFSQNFIIDPAIPAEKKFYPIRWLVVAVSLLSAMICAISILIFQQKWPDISKQLSE